MYNAKNTSPKWNYATRIAFSVLLNAVIISWSWSVKSKEESDLALPDLRVFNLTQTYQPSLLSPSVNSPRGENTEDVSDVVSSANDELAVFATSPFCTYTGHTADLLDISWSKVSLNIQCAMGQDPQWKIPTFLLCA